MGRKSDAKERLVVAASNLFREQGFNAVGIAKLCKLAEVHKGSFYHFFPSKKDLLLAVVEISWDETGFLTSWESQLPKDPVNAIQKYFEELFAFHYADQEASGYVRGSMFVNLTAEINSFDKTISNALQDLLNREVIIVGRVLEKAAKLNQVSLNSPINAARILVASIHGLLIFAKVCNDLSILPNSEGELLRLAGVIKSDQYSQKA